MILVWALNALPRPLLHGAASLPVVGVKPLFSQRPISTSSLAPYVFPQELPSASAIVVAVWQSPQGGGVLALIEHATDLSISHCKLSSVFWSTAESSNQFY